MDAHPGHIKEFYTHNPFTDFQRLREFPEVPKNPVVFQTSPKGHRIGILFVWTI
jgi:hypothetical protein